MIKDRETNRSLKNKSNNNKRIRPRIGRRGICFIGGNDRIVLFPTMVKMTTITTRSMLSILLVTFIISLTIPAVLIITPTYCSAFVVPALQSSSSSLSNIKNNSYNRNRIKQIPRSNNNNKYYNNKIGCHRRFSAMMMVAMTTTSDDDDEENYDNSEEVIDEFDDDNNNDDNDDDDDDDVIFLNRELERLESMEKMLEELEEYCSIEGMCEDDDDIIDDNDDDSDMTFLKKFKNSENLEDDDLDDMETFLSLLEEEEARTNTASSSLLYEDDDDDEDDEDFTDRAKEDATNTITSGSSSSSSKRSTDKNTVASSSFGISSMKGLEDALLQGVVPVNADVGSDTLPGDWNFDPMNFAEKDYMQEIQYKFLNILPGGNPDQDPPPEPRPSAIILRDYREAEIRHGRLAMLAVIIWPIQEKLDQLFLDEDVFGPIMYGPITLPYLPLFMTLIMMLLGYLDIYAKDIQEEENVGDAFLPGDCFWDPLKILQGAPSTMKRNMQERELFNGRVAMVAFAAFVFEELTSHRAIIDIPGNEILFVPAYQIPSVQEYLDSLFLIYSS
ncbi:MAG: light-harvesting complex I chlorophyll a/b binding protein 1 [Bacillariaceae sp.]|jgi:light-harvesting complex I chlorophyll a/b binding protein 1